MQSSPAPQPDRSATIWENTIGAYAHHARLLAALVVATRALAASDSARPENLELMLKAIDRQKEDVGFTHQAILGLVKDTNQVVKEAVRNLTAADETKG